MAIQTSYFASDLAAIILDLPTVAKVGATTFNVAASPLSQDQVLILTGNQDLAGVQITFLASSVSAEPAFALQGRLDLKYPNPTAFTHYHIKTIETSPDGLSYVAMLMQDNRG